MPTAEPAPMTPERLEQMRELARERYPSTDVVARAAIVDLLADRDHWREMYGFIGDGALFDDMAPHSQGLAAEVKCLDIDHQKLVEMTELRDRAELSEIATRRDAAVSASERASENVAALTAARAHLAVALLACAVCLGSGIAIGLGL